MIILCVHQIDCWEPSPLPRWHPERKGCANPLKPPVGMAASLTRKQPSPPGAGGDLHTPCVRDATGGAGMAPNKYLHMPVYMHACGHVRPDHAVPPLRWCRCRRDGAVLCLRGQSRRFCVQVSPGERLLEAHLERAEPSSHEAEMPRRIVSPRSHTGGCTQGSRIYVAIIACLILFAVFFNIACLALPLLCVRSSQTLGTHDTSAHSMNILTGYHSVQLLFPVYPQ